MPTPAEYAALKKAAFGPSYFWAHRGFSSSYPEDSTEAWDAATKDGYLAEGDVRQSSDGVQFLMHDPTVDRTVPPNVGNINAFTAAALDAMRYDRYNATGFANTPVSRYDAALAVAAANGGWCAPECSLQTLPAMQAVVAAAKAAGIAHRCIFQMFEVTPYPVLAQMVVDNPGLNFLVAFNTGAAQPNLQTIAAAGIKYVAMNVVDAWVNRAVFDAGHALGLKFVPYTVDTFADLAIAQAAGADHVFTNRPRFLARGALASPAPFNETWSDAMGTKWMWGDDYKMDGISLPAVGAARPNNGEVGQPTTANNATGAYCEARPLPPAATKYQLDFNVILRVANADNTRWGAIQFALQQNGLVKNFAACNGDGYACVFRQNGTFSIDKYVAGVASAALVSNAVGPALVVGTPTPFRLTVTPTDITLLRVDTGQSINTADVAFRAGILGFIWGQSGTYFGPITGVTIP